MVYGSAQTIRVVSQIYRERTMEEVSANQEKLMSSKSDQTDWIVSFCLCENCLFSNLHLNEMKWGTTKYQGIQNNLLASLPLN